MILRSLICDAVVGYFESADWTYLMNNLARGKEVRHAHIYTDSILDPRPMLKVIEGYFDAHGLPLQRKIFLLPQGHGMIDIYNIHPRQDMAHFEFFMRYSREQVLVPMGSAATRAGRTCQFWDDKFMKNHLAQYNFKTTLTSEDEKDLIGYFNSPEWKLQHLFMGDPESLHSHSMVETSIHPEIILEFGQKAIEAKGWELSKAVNVVFGVKGFDQGKITYLVRKPELVLELEWEFNPNISIVPATGPLVRKATTADLAPAMSGLEYLELDREAVQEIIRALKAKV